MADPCDRLLGSSERKVASVSITHLGFNPYWFSAQYTMQHALFFHLWNLRKPNQKIDSVRDNRLLALDSKAEQQARAGCGMKRWQKVVFRWLWKVRALVGVKCGYSVHQNHKCGCCCKCVS